MKSCRLIYKSVTNSTATSDAALAELEYQAAFNNKKFNIFGILFFSDNKFLQVLEGNPRYVRRLYKNITQDERNYNVELITYIDIDKPEFTDWSMKLVELNKLNGQYKKLLEKDTQLMLSQKFEETLYAQREIKRILKELEYSTTGRNLKTG